jgi:membrane-associated phospholipid phosphatase
MNRRFENIRSLSAYLLTSLVFILLGFGFLMMQDKSVIHLAINGLHSSFFDSFFIVFTYLGDGIFTAACSLLIALLLFHKYGWSPLILALLTLLFAGLFAQFFKQLLFPEALRPLSFFGDGHLRLIPGLEVYRHNSFPSGHTTSAFAFFGFVCLVLAKNRRIWQVLAALCAVGVGYSRMYLSQHFLEDVVFGASLGILAFLLALFLTRGLKERTHRA